jgi:hypothetical protein
MSKLKVEKIQLDSCPEGGEGEVLKLEEIVFLDINKTLIHNHVTRCINEDCSIKLDCKRYLQSKLDINQKNNFYYAEFTNIPNYTIDNPEESYDARKNCGKFIQN